jgi:hypothetical protein
LQAGYPISTGHIYGIKCGTITLGTKVIWDGTFIRFSPQP